MKLTQSFLGFILLITAQTTSVPHVVHEKRSIVPPGWKRRHERPSARTIIPLSFALTQRNLDLGPSYLMKVSDPDSTEYGKYWSPTEVVNTFSPSNSTITTVKSWLVDSGIDSDRIKLANGLNWLHVNVTLEEAETLLKAKYKLYGNLNSRALACDEYSLPVSVRDHIEFVKPTIQLSQITKRSIESIELSEIFPHIIQNIKPLDVTTEPPLSSWDLTYCNNYTTPACLRDLYNMPNGTSNLSSFGVLEFSPMDAYRALDLELFLQNLNPQIPSDTTPVVELIDQVSYQNNTVYLNTLETILDIDLAISLAYPQQVTLVSSPLTGLGPGQSPWDYLLEGIDAAYCDVAVVNTTIHGTCGGSFLPSVLSVSWGGQEFPSDAVYLERICNEYLKLSLQGHTLLFASGDYGVGLPIGCCAKPGCATSGTESPFSSNGTTFWPTFPASCPWITSVGGTRIAEGASVKDKEVVAYEEYIFEISAGSFLDLSWSSGGGFSNVFPLPDYQKETLEYYYQHFKPNYTAQQYNNTQRARGYPDISANGVNTVIYDNGTMSLTGGTSASCPIVASVITLINQERIKAGKSVVGFINPVIYKNPHAFNDILEGSNPGCGTRGFSATPGWDPATGLGTPNYHKLLEVFMALP